MKTWFIILVATAAIIVLGLYAVANAQSTSNLTTQWQGTALRVTWTAPGWHCLNLDSASLDCRYDSADLLLRTGGVDSAYAPRPGAILKLVDYAGNETARAVVPARLYRVILNWVRR